MRYSLKIEYWIAFSGLAAAAAGCGKGEVKVPVHPVQGQVFVNKKPAALALVQFHPSEDIRPLHTFPHAYVDDAGKFQLSTYGKNDGAPAGKYAVTIVWTGADEENRDNLPDRLQGRYSDPKTSPLRVTVKEGSNEVPPFNLK